MKEENLRHGAKRVHPLRHWLRRKLRPHKNNLGKASIPFDWTKGYDVEDVIGQLKVKDQGQSDSCGGQAAAYAFEIQRALLNVKEEISAKSIYAPIAYPGGGTTPAALQNYMAQKGANLESDVPSYQNGNPPTEAFMTDESWMTYATIQNAATRMGLIPITVDITMESIAEAIRDHGFTIWVIEGQNGNQPGWLSAYPNTPQAGNPNEIWEHFMCQKGAKTVNGLQQINSFQSWGASVGDNGRQYFHQNYIDSGHIRDVFTFVPASSVPPTASFWWRNFAQYICLFFS